MYNDNYCKQIKRKPHMEVLKFGDLAYETLPTTDEQILAIDQEIEDL